MVRRSILFTLILFMITCALAALCGCGKKNGVIGTGGGASITGISLTPTNPSIALSLSPASTQAFDVIANYSFGNPQDITDQMTWYSADTTVATIDSQGLAAAAGSGRVIISGSIQDPVSGKTFAVTTILTVVPQLMGITISPASAQIAKGTAQQFTATGKYNDGTSPNITSLVTWNSTQPAFASVSSSPGTQGLATGAAQGSTSISASLGTVGSPASPLTVTNANLVSISVTPAGSTVPLATSQQFTATGSFSDGTTQNISSTVNWTSSSPAIARVSSVGVVTGAGLGDTTITASSGAINEATTASVDASSVAGLNVLPAGFNVLPPETPGQPPPNPIPIINEIANLTNYQMRAVAVFQDGSSLDVTQTPGIEWSSSDSNVASVAASTGLALAKEPGTTTISATLGQSGSTSLTVSDSTITALTVALANGTIAPGTAENVVAIGSFSDSNGTFQQDISNSSAATWSSGSPGVACLPQSSGCTPYSSGLEELVTGVAAGSANISASFSDAHSNTATGFAALNVSSAELTGISVAPLAASVTSPASVTPEGALQFVATGAFTDGTQQDLTLISGWSAANGAIATVSSFGYAAASGPGQTSVGTTFNSQTGSSALLVNPGALTRIDVCAATVSNPLVNCPPLDPPAPPPPISFATGTSYGLIAIGTFAGGSRQNLTSSVQWSSGSPSVVTVSDDPGIPRYVTGVTGQGVATGLSPGDVDITATTGGVSGVAQVIVTSATPQSIAVTPANPAVTLGFPQAFTATMKFSDSTTQNVTPYVQWSSLNPDIAVVNPGGLAYSTGTGMASVSETASGLVVSAQGLVTVTMGNPSALGVFPWPVGSVFQFNGLTVSSGDVSLLNVTPFTILSESNPANSQQPCQPKRNCNISFVPQPQSPAAGTYTVTAGTAQVSAVITATMNVNVPTNTPPLTQFSGSTTLTVQ